MSDIGNIPQGRTGCRGFTLVEVLVTVLVLAVGLLGLASLQLNGLRYTHSSYFRSQATVLANDIIDRMRANRTAATGGAYDISVGTPPNAASCKGSGATCTPAQMADADLYDWKAALAAALPGGDGAVRQSGTGFSITIRWDDSRGQDTAREFTTETVL